MPSSQPNGHAVKRKRQSNETEYHYRKRVHTENEQEQTEEDDDISDDPNIEIALSIRTSLKYILSLKKNQLQQKITESRATGDILSEHSQLPMKTTDDLRLSLMAIAVYEHLDT